MAPIRTNKAIVAAAASGAAVTLFGCAESGQKQADSCDNYDETNCPAECDTQAADSCAVKNSEATYSEDDCKEYFGEEAWIEEPEKCINACASAAPVGASLLSGDFPEGDAESSAIWKITDDSDPQNVIVTNCAGVITVNDADDTKFDATDAENSACDAVGVEQSDLEDPALELQFYDAEALPQEGTAVVADWKVGDTECRGAITKRTTTYIASSATDGCSAELNLFELLEADLEVTIHACADDCIVFGDGDDLICQAPACDKDACLADDNCQFFDAVTECEFSGEDIQCSFEGENSDECSWSLKPNNQCVSVKDAECEAAAPPAIDAATALAEIDAYDPSDPEEPIVLVGATWEVQVDDQTVHCLGVISQGSEAGKYNATSVTQDCSATDLDLDEATREALKIQFINTDACGAINGCVVEFDENGVMCKAAAEIAACAAVEDASADSCAAVSTGKPATCEAAPDAGADNTCADVENPTAENCLEADECVFTEAVNSSFECRFEQAAPEDAEFIDNFCAEREAGCYDPTEDVECTIAEFATEPLCNDKDGCDWEAAECVIDWSLIESNDNSVSVLQAVCGELDGEYVEAQPATCEPAPDASDDSECDDVNNCLISDGCAFTDATPERCDLEVDPCASQDATCPDAVPINVEIGDDVAVDIDNICMAKAAACNGTYQQSVDPFAEDEE